MLSKCAVIIPSVCNLYFQNEESIAHLFFSCNYFRRVWKWLSSILNLISRIDNIEDCLNVMNIACSAQCKVVIRASIMAVINCIWRAHNQARFQNKKTPWRTTCSFIYSISLLAGNSATRSSTLTIR